jgi:anti-sigma-K factor RskA
MRYQDPRLSELLAAEYALGTLKGQARERFEKLLQAHPNLRRRVREWELCLNRLAEATPAVPPPPAVWTTLEQRLFPEPERPRWFERLNLWRGLALGSGALAGLLAVILLVGSLRETPGYVIMINDTHNQQPAWMVSTPLDMDRFFVKSLKVMDLPKGVRCMLWLQPEGSQQVYALGVLPDKGDEMMLDVARDKRTMMPGHLMVTVENVGDSMPTQPSGPVAYKGKWMPLKI